MMFNFPLDSFVLLANQAVEPYKSAVFYVDADLMTVIEQGAALMKWHGF